MSHIEITAIILSTILLFSSALIFSLIVIGRTLKHKVAFSRLSKRAFNQLEVDSRNLHSYAIPILCSLTIFTSINFRDQQEALHQLTWFIFSCGSFLAISSMAIFRTNLAKRILSNLTAKISLITFITISTWFSHAYSSETLRSSYHIDASNFPIALSAGTFLTASSFLLFPTLISAFIVELYVFIPNHKITRKNKISLLKLWRLSSPLAILLALLTSVQFMQIGGLSKKTELLVTRLAYDHDFTKNHFCKVRDKKSKVAFIISNQEIALKIPPPLEIKTSFIKIKTEELINYKPAKGEIVTCLSRTSP